MASQSQPPLERMEEEALLSDEDEGQPGEHLKKKSPTERGTQLRAPLELLLQLVRDTASGPAHGGLLSAAVRATLATVALSSTKRALATGLAEAEAQQRLHKRTKHLTTSQRNRWTTPQRQVPAGGQDHGEQSVAGGGGGGRTAEQVVLDLIRTRADLEGAIASSATQQVVDVETPAKFCSGYHLSLVKAL